jgi:hypothetical protein
MHISNELFLCRLRFGSITDRQASAGTIQICK